MRAVAARRLAIDIAAGTVALVAGALVLAYLDRHVPPAGLTGWNLSDVSGDMVDMAVPVVGLVLAFRRPANRIGWLFLAAGLADGLWAFSTSYTHHALIAAPGSVLAGHAFAWLSNWNVFDPQRPVDGSAGNGTRPNGWGSRQDSVSR